MKKYMLEIREAVAELSLIYWAEEEKIMMQPVLTENSVNTDSSGYMVEKEMTGCWQMKLPPLAGN